MHHEEFHDLHSSLPTIREVRYKKIGPDIYKVCIRKNSGHGKSEVKKSFGRLKHRHEDNIKTNQTETVYVGMCLTILSQYKCRSVANTAMNCRVK